MKSIFQFGKKRPKEIKKKIRIIIFDLGKVVLHFDIQKTIDRLVKVSRAPFLKMRLQLFASGTARSYERGEISSEEFYQSAVRFLGVRVDPKTFWAYWNDIFWDNPEMEPILKCLSKNYPLYLLSNTNEQHFDYIEKNYPVLRYFKEVFPSHRMKARKPEKKIYQETLRQIGCDPGEAVFIDDIPRNIRAARRCGIHAVQYRGSESLVRSLRKLGVQVNS